MNAESPLALECTQLARRFGRRRVFSGISFRVPHGGVMAITGANGSGKSTLLKVIGGLLAPSSGQVRFTRAGCVLERAEVRRHIGYVAPDVQLYRELTGVENLRFIGRLRGRELSRDQLAELLDYVGLLGRGSDLVASYSSGMRQRLKLAASLIHAPEVLLLDEPTANLDAIGADVVRRTIAAQRSRGLVVLATNEPAEAAWADEAIHLGAA